MAKTKKQYSSEFKLKAVIEILKGEKTATQIAGELGTHPLVLTDWKKQFLETGTQIFARRGKSSRVSTEAQEKAELFEQIGRLKMKIKWLKKIGSFELSQRRALIESSEQFSLVKQCRLLGISQSGI